MQARIMALNASYFLKTGGHFVISIKVCLSSAYFLYLVQLLCYCNLSMLYMQNLQASCIDSTVPAEAVFASEVSKLQAEQFKPMEQVTLEPFERDHACVVGAYRVPKKSKLAAS